MHMIFYFEYFESQIKVKKQLVYINGIIIIVITGSISLLGVELLLIASCILHSDLSCKFEILSDYTALSIRFK